MTEMMNRLSNIISIPTLDPEDARRRKLLNIMLLGVALGVFLLLVALLVTAPLGLAGEREEVIRLSVSIVVILLGVAAVFALNRYGSGELASSLFLLLLMAVIAFSDEPREIVDGRSLFLFAIPIVGASVLLRPWASFAGAGLSCLVIVLIGLGVPLHAPNVPAILGLFVLALMSWLSARSLERAMRDLRGTNTALAESEERFRSIVETALSLLHITDARGNNLYVSPNCEEIVGYTQEELQGTLRWWVHEDDTPRARELFARIFREGVGGRDFEYKAVKKNGEVWYASSSWEPLWDEEGKFKGIVMQTIDISERKRAEEKLWQRQLQLSILNRLGVALAGTLELERVYHIAFEHVAQLVDCPCFGVSLYDPATRTLRAEFMLDDGELIDAARFPPLVMDAEPTRGRGRAIATRQPEIIADFPTLTEGADILVIGASGDNRTVGSAMYVPMVVRGQVTGLLEVQSHRVNAYGAEEAALLGPVANQIGLAIENARLYQAEQERRHIAETLRQAATALSSTLEIDEVLELMLQQLRQVIPYDSASVQRLQGERLEIVACQGFAKPDKVVGLVFPLDPVFPNCRVVTTKAVLAVEDIAQDYPHFKDEADTYESGRIGSWLGAPLMVKDEVIGMIAVDRAEVQPYTAEEGQLAMAFANQAAVAMENARLYDQARQEIAERERAEEELRLRAAMMDNVAEGVYLIGLDDLLIKWTNERFTRMFGYDPGEMVGKHVDIVNAPTERTPTETRISIVDVLKETGEWHGEVRNIKRDGTHFWCYANVSLFDHPEYGKVIVSVHTNITERKQAEEVLKEYSGQLEEMVDERTQELRDAQEKLVRQERLAVLGQLAGGVAHELRNPLAAISNAVYFLNMVTEKPDPEVKEMLEIMEKEVRTSERIISSLLDFARPQPPIRRIVDVNDVVRETLSRATVPDSVEVVRQLEEPLPTVLADPDQLVQVFGNLMLNAVQAMTLPTAAGTPEGGRLVVRSDVSGRGDPAGRPEWVTVSITDTGEGIPEENLEKIFEPLFTTKAKGIGLGLALVKTLAEANGGSIEVESEVGKGSIFTVKLPAREA